jgi:spermidine synthase
MEEQIEKSPAAIPETARPLPAWLAWIHRLFPSRPRPARRPMWALFLVSFAALYTEVMLIRWIGTEVRVFAFFQNLALIACFLGFGLGCYWSKRPKNIFFSLLAMAALVVLVQIPMANWQFFLKGLSSLLSRSPDAALWGAGRNPTGAVYMFLFAAAVLTLVYFLGLLVAIMVPMGQWVAYYLETAPNTIAAYSVNLLGSVAGIWLIAGLAFLWLPPRYWFGFAFVILLLVALPPRRTILASAFLLAASLFFLGYKHFPSDQVYWSPYQKLDVQTLGHSQYIINVNNTGYMTIANMTPQFLRENPRLAEDYRGSSSYDTPYRFAQSANRVLIVGAGAGNDAAAALRNGAQHVDAVEIDPVIRHLGVALHPEHPYESPKVRVILNDARAFLRRTHQRYDVIVFGLLDSHTQFSDFSNMRIDNYVYTEESFREARRLLATEGILVVKFEVRAPWEWMGQRFYALLDHIFGRPPIVFYAPQVGRLVSASVFIESNSPGLWTRAESPVLAAIIRRNPPRFPLTLKGAPPLTTDNWPYVYHRERTVPKTFLTVSLILLAMAAFLVRDVLEVRKASTWLFFFLGAGFLLLETQMVSRLALYFGTTWLVNCIALTAILLVLVVANLFVERCRPRNLGPFYILLVVGLVGNYFFPWHTLPYSARTLGILLSLAYSVPLFFAGVIFTEMFRRAEGKAAAFGANIVGAVAGGLAQNLSFIFGMKMLLLAAACSYAVAAFSGRFSDGPRVAKEAVTASVAEG